MSGLRAFLGEHADGLLDNELVLDALDLATCGVMIRHWRNDSVDTSDASASLSIFVSRKFKSTFDVISTDEVGFEPSHIDSIIHPEDRQHHCHRNERPTDHGPMPVAEYRLRDRSGRYRPVRDQAVQLTLADGNAVSISVLTDDDPQREHQQNLWDRSQDIQRILDTVPTCIWYKDQSGRILRCNRAAAEATGLSVAEIEGRLTEEVYPRHRDQFNKSDRAVMSDGNSIQNVIETLQSRDGKVRQLVIDKYVLTGQPELTGGDGDDEKRILVVGTDVTDSERLLQRLRLATENGHIGFWEWTLADQSVEVTQEFLNQLGQSVPWRSFEDFSRYVHPDDRQDAIDYINSYLANDDPNAIYESIFRLRHADGTYRWMLSRATRIHSPSGEFEKLSGFHVDITEQQENRLQLQTKQRDLQRSNEDLNRFAYVASHDLKAPLRRLRVLCEWIEQDAGDEVRPEVTDHLQRMDQQVQRMELLLDDLLAYSRVNRRPHADETVNLSEMIATLFDFMSPPDGLVLTVDVADDQLHTDRAALEQALRNLIGNAIRHAASGGNVTVRQTRQSDISTFSVSDRGPGIASDFHERIFGMFEMLPSEAHSEGTGMGLALVKRLVEQRGGRIWLESSVGHGATFLFTWPDQGQSDSTESDAKASEPFRRRRRRTSANCS